LSDTNSSTPDASKNTGQHLKKSNITRRHTPGYKTAK